MKKQELAVIGLSPRESEVYLAVLHGGQLTQSGIAEATKMNRTTLYRHIDSLLRAGYIGKTIRGKRLYYFPENPDKLVKQLATQQQTLEAVLPGLRAVYARSGHQPTITTYQGSDGIARAFREAAETAHYIKTFFSPTKYFSVLSMKEANYVLETTRKREVDFKGLCSDSPEGRKFVKKYKNLYMKNRLMPYGLGFPTEFMIYNHKVVIVSFERQFAAVIESADIKEFLETLFDHFWAMAKEK